jgi:hypothetical protein
MSENRQLTLISDSEEALKKVKTNRDQELLIGRHHHICNSAAYK